MIRGSRAESSTDADAQPSPQTGERSKIEHLVAGADQATQGTGEPLPGEGGRNDVAAGRVGRKRRQDDSTWPHQETWSRIRPGSETRDDDARRFSAAPVKGRCPWPMVHPATVHVLGKRFEVRDARLDATETAHIVVSLEDKQAHAAIGEPCLSRRRSSAVRSQGRGDSSRSPATISRESVVRSSKALKASQRLAQRMCDHAVAGRATGPFVSEMNVGDHGSLFAAMDCSPFRSELPAFEQREAWFFRRRARCSSDMSRVSRGPDARATGGGRRRAARSGGSRARRAQSRPRRMAKARASHGIGSAADFASQLAAAGTSRISSSTSRRVSRSRGWSGQADLISGIEPRADPVQAADAHAATVLRGFAGP